MHIYIYIYEKDIGAERRSGAERERPAGLAAYNITYYNIISYIIYHI